MLPFNKMIQEMMKVQYCIDNDNNTNISNLDLINLIEENIKQIENYILFFNLFHFKMSLLKLKKINKNEFKEKILDLWSLILTLSNMELNFTETFDSEDFNLKIKKYLDSNAEFNKLMLIAAKNKFYFKDIYNSYILKNSEYL